MESLGVNETWIMEAGNNTEEGTMLKMKLVFFDVANVMLVMLEFVWTFCSLFTNGCVLFALWKIPSKERFNSKALLMNSVVSDSLYSVSNFITGGIYIAIALGVGKTIDETCYMGLKSVFVTTFQYSQAMASACLSLDRVYAIAAPMTYYTTGYSSAIIALIVSFVWGVSFVLTSSFFVLTADKPGLLCTVLEVNKDNWTHEMRYPFQITLYVFALLIYMALFAKVKFQQSSLSKVTNSNFTQSIRLIVTFLAIHLTTFLLFLPGPAWAAIFAIDTVEPPPYSRQLMSNLLVQFYSINCIVNPLIIMTKVPAVKAQLQFIWKRNTSEKTLTEDKQTSVTAF